MAKPIGPTIPRWQLGEQLQRLRIAAGYSRQQTAERLRCSVSKIEKVEGGQVRAKLAELETMLVEYGVPEHERPPLLELQRLGSTRGWWSKFGRLPLPFTEFLGLEMAAETIRNFELAVVPGLFQTESYIRALAHVDTPAMTDEMVERQVELRLGRQKQIFGEHPPQMLTVIDESVLRRKFGNAATMREQLDHLVDVSAQQPIQVVPLDHGGYPGIRGPLVIFEFPEDLHSPVAYTEGQAGNLYMEKSDDIHRSKLMFEHILGAALSRPKSLALIKDLARQLDD
jgi:transcriptional regulator with XRE-family HTH domain